MEEVSSDEGGPDFSSSRISSSRALAIYLALMVILRGSGKRSLAQITSFDLVLAWLKERWPRLDRVIEGLPLVANSRGWRASSRSSTPCSNEVPASRSFRSNRAVALDGSSVPTR